MDNEETLKLISDDDLKELVPVVGDRLLTKKILNQFFTASHDEQCVCFASSKYFKKKLHIKCILKYIF